MRTLAEFTKTTLIGGVLIILPVYLAALLLAKTVKGMLELLSPAAAQIPTAVEFRQVLAIALLVAVCFIVGLIVRTGPGFARRMPSSGRCWKSFPATHSSAGWPVD
jgi:uncharacterized membrane protein